MAKFNLNLLQDELSLPAWLALGALAQAGVSIAAPAQYALVPAALVLSILGANFVLQYLGLYRNYYTKDARLGRVSILFPEKDGSRPEDMGDKPVAMFLLGLRSNSPIGRLLPAYQKLNNYLDDMYQDADENRATNGCESHPTRSASALRALVRDASKAREKQTCGIENDTPANSVCADLGRTPDLIAKEFAHNNSLYSISYWKSLEDLEAWARRPVHLRGLRFLDFEVNKSGRPFDLGVVVSLKTERLFSCSLFYSPFFY